MKARKTRRKAMSSDKTLREQAGMRSGAYEQSTSCSTACDSIFVWPLLSQVLSAVFQAEQIASDRAALRMGPGGLESVVSQAGQSISWQR